VNEIETRKIASTIISQLDSINKGLNSFMQTERRKSSSNSSKEKGSDRMLELSAFKGVDVALERLNKRVDSAGKSFNEISKWDVVNLRKGMSSLVDRFSKTEVDFKTTMKKISDTGGKMHNDLMQSVLSNQGRVSDELVKGMSEYVHVLNQVQKGTLLNKQTAQELSDKSIKFAKILEYEGNPALTDLFEHTKKLSGTFSSLATYVEESGKEYVKVGKLGEKISELTRDMDDGIKGIKDGASLYADTMEKATEAKKEYIKNIRTAALAVAGVVTAQVTNDITRSMRANVTELEYIKAGLSGVSAGFRAEFEGTNRDMLRTVAQGAAGGSRAGMAAFGDLTKRFVDMGFTGEESYQIAMQSLNNMAGMGITPTAEAMQSSADYIQDFGERMGMTTQQVGDFMASLKDSGALRTMASNMILLGKHSQEAMHSEIESRMANARQMRWSNEIIQEQIQMQQGQRYESVRESMRRMVGVEMGMRQSGVTLTADEERIARQGAVSLDSLSEDERSQFHVITQKMREGFQTGIAEGAQEFGQSGNMAGLLSARTVAGIFDGLAGGMSSWEKAEENLVARHTAYGESANAVMDALARGVDPMNEIANSFINFQENFDTEQMAAFKEWTATVSNWIKGLVATPFGPAAAGLMSIGSSIANLYMLSKITAAVGGAATLGGGAATLGGGLLRGAGRLVGRAGLVGTAGAAGYGLGTLAYNNSESVRSGAQAVVGGAHRLITGRQGPQEFDIDADREYHMQLRDQARARRQQLAAEQLEQQTEEALETAASGTSDDVLSNIHSELISIKGISEREYALHRQFYAREDGQVNRNSLEATHNLHRVAVSGLE